MGRCGHPHRGPAARHWGRAAFDDSKAQASGRGHHIDATGSRANRRNARRQPVRAGGYSYDRPRSEEHTSELQSLMRISYAVFCLKKKKNTMHISITTATLTHYQE